MANTEPLSIYKCSYDLCLYLEQVAQGFSRYHEYSLGTDVRDSGKRALKLVARANSRRDKAAVLLNLREELEELKVLLRLGQDAKAFANFNSFEHAIGLVSWCGSENGPTVARLSAVCSPAEALPQIDRDYPCC